ncbi:MAG: DUF4364 family protein [Clostridiales bacterium]|nr:DUF4364 family protein [Clostridiales bacterium]
MARIGFIRDKLDIKMLELYLMARVAGPIDFDTLVDLAMRHEGVDYFELAEATAELVESGHLALADERYSITEKGRVNSAACESSLPYSVRRRCNRDLAPVNAALRRNAQVRGEKRRNADGSVVARMALDDNGGNLLTIDLLCPSEAQADRLISRFKSQPEQVYNEVLEALLASGESEERSDE